MTARAKLTHRIPGGHRYEATMLRGDHAGLIVAKVGGTGGKFMPAAHPQYLQYVEALHDALDAVEYDDLCRGVTQ